MTRKFHLCQAERCIFRMGTGGLSHCPRWAANWVAPSVRSDRILRTHRHAVDNLAKDRIAQVVALSPRMGVQIGLVAGADEEVAGRRARLEATERNGAGHVAQAGLGRALVGDRREGVELVVRPADDGALLGRTEVARRPIELAAVIPMAVDVAQEIMRGDRRPFRPRSRPGWSRGWW